MKKTFIIVMACALVLAAVTVGVAALRMWEFAGGLDIALNGEDKFYLEYGHAYQEPGAAATLTDGDDITRLDVDISGQVNPAKLGKYLIKYTARAGERIRTEYRYVYVVDTELPMILLNENPDTCTLIGEPYIEEGFTATDNHDGDLTDKVIRTEADGVVTYTVTDSSGNTATVSRIIEYIDPGAPELTLEGSRTAFIMAGEIYQDPGYRATDRRDGDLTDDVTVSGSIDTLIPGIYTLQYSIANSYGKTVTKERTVYVVPRAESDDSNEEDTGVMPIEPNGKVIYLTFDDGPSQHTGRLLDVLAKYNVKATFFVVKTSYQDMIARTAQEGHTVAIHTYTHRYSQIYASDAAFLADLQAIEDVIVQQTGQKPTLTRFPGGSSNSVSKAYNKGIMTRLTKTVEEMGYRYFDWNVDSNDAGGAKTADEVFQNVITRIGDRTNSVVLQHDTQGFSVDAVERIIAWGLCNGYTFLPLTSDSPACQHYVNN